MSSLTVEGIYKDGKVELTERPQGVADESRVLVTFLPENEAAAQHTLSAEERERLRQQAFARMERGIDLGGPPYPKREELYDRVRRLNDRLDQGDP